MSIELGGGYCTGSAIYGLDSFPLLVPSHTDYSKVDLGLSDRAYFLQKGRNYVHKIKFSFFIIDSGSFKCYMGTLVTNLQLFYITTGVTRIKPRNPFKNLSFSTRWHWKPKKDKVKGRNAILNCLEGKRNRCHWIVWRVGDKDTIRPTFVLNEITQRSAVQVLNRS